MKKLFFNKTINLGDIVKADQKDFFHLSNVLRVKQGERFLIGDLEKNEYIGTIKNINKNEIFINIDEKHIRKQKNNIDITLIFALLKSDKNDFIIQKCAEIGVNKFIPVITQNCILNLNEKKMVNKINRMRTIALQSAMQSGRDIVPEIVNIKKIENVVELYEKVDYKYFAFFDSKKHINDIKVNSKKITVFIGPEGDFTDNEIQLLLSSGWEGIKLSENTLRSETAAVCSSVLLINILKRNEKL